LNLRKYIKIEKGILLYVNNNYNNASRAKNI
jgi:hypothetical protein